MRIRVGFMLIRRRGKKERALKGTVIIIENWDIRVSGTIVKPSDVRVEEIALCVWGKACVRTRFAEVKRKKRRVGSYHAFLLFPFDLEQFSRHDNELWLFWRSERVGGIICFSASAERLCPRGTSARMLDHVRFKVDTIRVYCTVSPAPPGCLTTAYPLWYNITSSGSAFDHSQNHAVLIEAWTWHTMPRIHKGHNAKVYCVCD